MFALDGQALDKTNYSKVKRGPNAIYACRSSFFYLSNSICAIHMSAMCTFLCLYVH